MPRFSMILVYILFVQEKNPYFGIVLNTKETLFDFLGMLYERLARDLSHPPVTAQVGS